MQARLMDCQNCGACCTNPDENRHEGYSAYVEVDAAARLLRKPDLRKRFVIISDAGLHMRLDPSGRCAALEGKLGIRVKCRVYADRPRACRLVEPHSPACLTARRERFGV